LKGSKDN